MEPILDEGWFMAWNNRLALVYMDGRVSEPSFARYLAAVARDIDQAPEQPRAVLYDTPSQASFSAARRRQLGEVLDRRKEKLRRITAGYVMVTPHTVVRGMLTAIFWLAPPPYENRVTATTDEGFRWLATRCPWLDPQQAEAHYTRLRAGLLARMLPSPDTAMRASG